MKIEIFKNNEFGEVRVTRDNDEILFIGKDVAQVLGYKRPADAIRQLVDDDDKGVAKIPTPGGMQEMIVINESGLYSLILSSKLEKAKQFKKWVTKEVLPDIRKSGMYMTNGVVETLLTNPDEFLKLANAYVEEVKHRKALEEKVTILTHTRKLYTSTEMAKELGFKSAIAFNKELQKRDIQFKVNNTWVLKNKYAELGYESIKQHILDNGTIIYDRKWTQIGREFLLNLFKGEK